MENMNRNPGHYWVKFQGNWGIALWTGRRWEYDLSVMIAEDFEEISDNAVPMPGNEPGSPEAEAFDKLVPDFTTITPEPQWPHN